MKQHMHAVLYVQVVCVMSVRCMLAVLAVSQKCLHQFMVVVLVHTNVVEMSHYFVGCVCMLVQERSPFSQYTSCYPVDIKQNE